MAVIRENSRKKTQFSFAILKDKLTIPLVLAILIAFGLFIVSLITKEKLGNNIFNIVGWNWNFTYENLKGDKITWFFEAYSDRMTYYEPFIEAFLFDGWNPYTRSEGILDNYVYGPFFLYFLAFFYFIVKIFNPAFSTNLTIEMSVKWYALVFDALSVMMIYIMIIGLECLKKKRIIKHLVGIIASLAFSFMPMNLFYIDSYYLNTPQMTFFTLLGLFLFLKERYRLAAFSFTIGWLTKQVPLFFIIPLFFILKQKENMRFALKRFFFPFIGLTLLFSIPWIFMNPLLYPVRIIGSGRPLWYATLDDVGNKHGVTLAHTVLYLGGGKILSQIFVYVNVAMIPFLITYLLAIFMSHFNGKSLAENEMEFFIYFSWLNILLHVFLSRGLFKYYDAFFNPFLILLAVILPAKSVNYLHRKRNLEEPFSKNSDKTFFSRKQNIVIYALYIFILMLLIIASASLNILIMKTIRFVHPLLLYVLLLLITPLLPIRYVTSLDQKENYRLFKDDFKDIFKQTKQLFLSFINSLLKKDKEI